MAPSLHRTSSGRLSSTGYDTNDSGDDDDEFGELCGAGCKRVPRPRHWCVGLLVALFAIGIAGIIVAATPTAREAALNGHRRDGEFILSAGAARAGSLADGLSLLAYVFADRCNRTHIVSDELLAEMIGHHAKFGATQSLLSGLMAQLYVADAERTEFEARLGQPIRTTQPMDPSAPVSPQTIQGPPFEPHAQPYYLPVVAVYPPEHKWRVSYDFSERSPVQFAAIRDTIELGVPVTGAAIHFPGVTHPKILVHQVIDTSSPARPYDGVLTLQLSLEAFAELFADDKVDMLMQLTDDTGLIPEVLYTSPGVATAGSLTSVGRRTFTFGMRKWTANLMVPDESLASNDSSSAEVMSVGAIVGAVIGLLVLWLLHSRHLRSVEKQSAFRDQAVAETHVRMLRLMNHELRNPLTVVKTTLDLLAEQQQLAGVNQVAEMTPEQAADAQLEMMKVLDREDVSHMRHAVATMQRALDDMLHIAVLEKGSSKLEEAPLNVHSLVRDIRHYASAWQGNSPAVVTAEDVPQFVVADRCKLRQLVVDTIFHMQHFSKRTLTVSVSVVGVDVLMFTMYGMGVLPRDFSKKHLQSSKKSPMAKKLAEMDWKPPVEPAWGVVSSYNEAQLAMTPSSPVHRVKTSTALGRLSSRGAWQHANSTMSSTSDHEEFTHRGQYTLAGPGTTTLGYCSMVAGLMGGVMHVHNNPANSVLYIALPLVLPPPSLAKQTSLLGASAIQVTITPPQQSNLPFDDPSFAETGVGHRQSGSTRARTSARTSASSLTSRGLQPGAGGGEAPTGQLEDDGKAIEDGSVHGTLAVHSTPESTAGSSANVPDLVVVVDDEKLIRKCVTRQLKKLGAQVVAMLEDGDELIPALEGLEQQPTCILLDIVMRRCDGVTALIRLRQSEEFKHIPVYAMTSNVESVDLYKNSGFDGMLGKPFGRTEVERVLEHSKLPDLEFLLPPPR